MDNRLRTLLSVTTMLAITAIAAFPARAIDLLPFDYVPAPAGTNAVLGYYLHGQRNRFDSANGTRIPNSELDSHIFAARFTRWDEIRGTPVGAQIILPYGALENGRLGGTRLNEPSGLFDPTLTLGFGQLTNPSNDGSWRSPISSRFRSASTRPANRSTPVRTAGVTTCRLALVKVYRAASRST
jgi:hypothetical protein